MATLRLGDTAPDFTAKTTEGTINYHEWLGDSWGLLFSHPADFTPVCTTELGRTASLKNEFEKRNVKVLALSVDPMDAHTSWIKDIEETQNVKMNFPLIADEDRKVAMLYDMIHPNASEKATVRSVFIIGPDKKVKLTLTYPASTGRNFLEILRVIDSQDVVIVPSVPDEDIPAKFPKGHKRIKPYLRMTPQPNL
jgi:thioredoxin-dependent peroxiredoxin